MRVRLLAAPALAVAALALLVPAASAGEVNGVGERTGAYTKSNSECAFSGLEDGSEGIPGGPGARPQNFGHSQQDAKAGLFGPEITSMADIKAAGFNPGKACNGHLAGRK